MTKRTAIAVYIVANSRRTIYIGVTNNILRRVYEYKFGEAGGWAKRYNLTKLVYYEPFDSMRQAIEREKQLKGWLRSRKNALIEEFNPTWQDLAKDWYENDPSQLAKDQGPGGLNE